MNGSRNASPEPDDVEHLLPWLVTGKLPAAERARAEAGLAADERLKLSFALARDEWDEVVAANEAVQAPSPRVGEALFREIEAAPPRRGFALARGLPARIFSGWTPPRLAFAAALASLVIVAESIALGHLLLGGGTAAYHTASAPSARVSGGTIALVGFAPDATAAQITALLDELGFSIVDGPRGGLYRLRVSPDQLSPEAADPLLAKLRARSHIVRFAARGS